MYEYNLGIKFENIASRYPHHPAIKFSKSNSISYAQLNRKVNQFARHLLKKNVGTGDVVCIAGTKDILTFICMLACLKIGVAYSIIDDQSPVERLERIITTCLPKVLFIDAVLAKSLKRIIQKLHITVIRHEVKDLENKLKQYPKGNLELTRSITGTNPAYIMFTSGSTGFPKGALMTHDNLLNLISWSIDTFNIRPQDILTNVNPLYFDNSVFDFSSALFSGACLVPFPRDVVANSKLLVSQIDKLKCTLWFSVPSLLIYIDTMKVLNKTNMQYITRFIFGGEGYPKPKLKHLFDLYATRCDIFNVYGPTECTCICSSYQITAEDFTDFSSLPPLGKLAANFSYLILDDKGNKVIPNQIGELCLLGPNVGKGYYNDPDRTKEKFIPNPHNPRFTEVMYKTGDLVKYNSRDGYIYFVGRADNQVKHMGYRIELDEIELALNRLKYISQAAVIHGYIRKLSQIVAVVSSRQTVDEQKIRRDLQPMLPEYMIPNRIYVETELPKNPNGKIDRKKLAGIYFKWKILASALMLKILDGLLI